MHSLEANALPAERVSVASQDIVGGRISPNINLATSYLASLRRPSVPFAVPNFTLIRVSYVATVGRQTSKSLAE